MSDPGKKIRDALKHAMERSPSLPVLTVLGARSMKIKRVMVKSTSDELLLVEDDAGTQYHIRVSRPLATRLNNEMRLHNLEMKDIQRIHLHLRTRKEAMKHEVHYWEPIVQPPT